MNKADEALADVRGWLCDNLSEGDAGRGCGMLSVVSRHITELESENAELRHMLARYMRQAYVQACDKGNPITVGIIEDDARELGIEVPHD